MALRFGCPAVVVSVLLVVVGTADVLVLNGLRAPSARLNVALVVEAEPAPPRPRALNVSKAVPRSAPVHIVPRSDPRVVRSRSGRPGRIVAQRQVSRPTFTQTAAQQRGSQALASLHRPVAHGWTVRFAVYRGRYVGFADATKKVVTLWVKPTDSQQNLRITLAHELGHVLDYTRLTEARRADYLEIRGRGGYRGRWYPCDGCEDYAAAAGDFAEVYAYWLAGAGDFRSRFAAAPDRAQLDRLGAFFTQLERAPLR